MCRFPTGRGGEKGVLPCVQARVGITGAQPQVTELKSREERVTVGRGPAASAGDLPSAAGCRLAPVGWEGWSGSGGTPQGIWVKPWSSTGAAVMETRGRDR